MQQATLRSILCFVAFCVTIALTGCGEALIAASHAYAGDAQANAIRDAARIQAGGSSVAGTSHVSNERMNDGSTYSGEMIAMGDGWRRPHGRGTQTNPNGSTFQGEWSSGVLRRGTKISKSGLKLEGEWRDDNSFRGTLTDPDGVKMEGEWKDEQFVRGTLYITRPNGTNVESDWRDGRVRTQSGVDVYPDGVRQTGNWDHESMRGSGTIEWPSGQRYEGPWKLKDGQLDDPDGEGVMTWPDGRRYAGEFRDGKKSGRGRMTYPDGRVEDGTWLADEFTGQATTVAPAAGVGEVSVGCDTEGCEVFVDDKFVGNTPAKLKLAPGPHKISVRKGGFKDYLREVEVTPGSELTLKAVLEPN